MKKFFKRFLLFFCLPLAILAIIVFAPAAFIRYCMPERFDYHDNTAHFSIYYNESDKSAIEDLKNQLESSYERITTDLKQPMNKSTTIKVYPDLNTFHSTLKFRSCEGNGLLWWINVLFSGERGDWYLGNTDGTTGEIRIVSPLNPDAGGCIPIHEFTHAVVNEVTSNSNRIVGTTFGKLLNEGIAVYESGQRVICDNISTILPESIDKLPTSSEFAYAGGYLFVKYVVENYGYDKLIELLKKDYSGGNYDSETRRLYNEWVEYIKTNQN